MKLRFRRHFSRSRKFPIGSKQTMKKSMPRAPHHLRRRRSEEHTSELQSPCNLVCRLLLEKKKPLKDAATLSGYIPKGGSNDTFFVCIFLPDHPGQVVPPCWGRILSNLPNWLRGHSPVAHR